MGKVANVNARARITVIKNLLEHLWQTDKEKAREKLSQYSLLKSSGFFKKEKYDILDFNWQIDNYRVYYINDNFKKYTKELNLQELATWNTWFYLHPEKVAGKEELTTSIRFPITVKGDKNEVIETLSRFKKLKLTKAKAQALLLLQKQNRILKTH